LSVILTAAGKTGALPGEKRGGFLRGLSYGGRTCSTDVQKTIE